MCSIAASGRVDVVDEIGLREHDHRCGTAVVGQHELPFEPSLVGRRAQRVHEEDDVDVGGEGLGFGAGTLERRPADEGAASRQELVDPLAVLGHDHPVAHRDVGADVADPERRRSLIARAGRREERRPAAVDPAHPSGRPRRPACQGGPRLVEGGVPAQRAQILRHGGDRTDAVAAGQRTMPAVTGRGRRRDAVRHDTLRHAGLRSTDPPPPVEV